MTTSGAASPGQPVRSAIIDGVVTFTPTRFDDDRGWFSRTLDLEWCDRAGLETQFVHHNQSRSRHGVLRGLHVRGGPSETKLVRCSRGAVVDFVVDTRPWSATFGRVERFELDDVAFVHLYLPPFVAHGFQVVSDDADVCYLHSRAYEADADVAISWADPSLAIDWPIDPPIISERDSAARPLDEIDLGDVFERPTSVAR